MAEVGPESCDRDLLSAALHLRSTSSATRETAATGHPRQQSLQIQLKVVQKWYRRRWGYFGVGGTSAASAGAGVLQHGAAGCSAMRMWTQNRWQRRLLSSQHQEAISIVPYTQRLLLPSLVSFTGSSWLDGSHADRSPSLVPVALVEPREMFRLPMGSLKQRLTRAKCADRSWAASPWVTARCHAPGCVPRHG